jgi:hypothetical protein
MSKRDEAVNLLTNALDSAAHGRPFKGRRDQEAGVGAVVDALIDAVTANLPAAPKAPAARKKVTRGRANQEPSAAEGEV